MTIDERFRRAYELVTARRADEAVQLARSAASLAGGAWTAQTNLDGILIDAGQGTRNRTLVAEGISILEAALPAAAADARADLHYNLANGYLAYGQLEPGRGPLTRRSLARAVSHFAASVALKPRAQAEINLAKALNGQGRYVEAAQLLTTARRFVIVPQAAITYVSSLGGVTTAYTDAGRFWSDLTLTDLERRLDTRRFLRVDQSHIVNLTRVAELVPWTHQRYRLVFAGTGQTELVLSRDVGRRLRAALGW